VALVGTLRLSEGLVGDFCNRCMRGLGTNPSFPLPLSAFSIGPPPSILGLESTLLHPAPQILLGAVSCSRPPPGLLFPGVYPRRRGLVVGCDSLTSPLYSTTVEAGRHHASGCWSRGDSASL